MKRTFRALALLAIAGATLLWLPNKAEAFHVGVGIGIGGPGYYGGPVYYGGPAYGPRYWVPGHWLDHVWVPGHWVYEGPGPYYGGPYYGGPAVYIGGGYGGWHHGWHHR